MIEPDITLSPAYDMLPMLYAPMAVGEVPIREFQLTLPNPQEQDIWSQAFRMAIEFWNVAANDARITVGFREICESNLTTLEAINQKLDIL